MQEQKNIGTGKIAWRSPSNIALVKYWGKKGRQIPANPSLSMTLSRAVTEMTLEYHSKDENESAWLEFYFDGHKQEKFEEKIAGYLQSLFAEYPFLSDLSFRVSSSNTFPHSTGIASSASSMSALGLCLAELAERFSGNFKDTSLFMREASRLSRLASGSACRSVYGGYVIWGFNPRIPGTSDEYAIPFPFEVHNAFRNMKDAILVVSGKEKEVSSRAGHALMEGHPYAPARYESAVNNILDLSDALKKGDMEDFIRITESEALNLHALMMSSRESYLLLEPNTVNIVKSVRQFRKDSSVPLCFTLDAGPNVHLLYPAGYESIVRSWIEEELVKYCENGKWIDDRIGEGAERL